MTDRGGYLRGNDTQGVPPRLRGRIYYRATDDSSIRAGVAVLPGLHGIASGQESHAGGGADGRGGVERGEPDAFPGHTVEVRRRNSGVSVATEIAVSHVVGEQNDEIWSCCSAYAGPEKTARPPNTE